MTDPLDFPAPWDAIVVGAGPAGSVAAFDLARAGARVLVVDRAASPRDKACGDALPPAALELLGALGVRVPVAIAERLTFVSPGGRSVSMPRLPGLDAGLVRRSILDHALLEAAIAAGATHRVSAVTGLLRGRRGEVVGVTTDRGPERAPVVIGADGATSIVARHLERRRPAERARSVAIRGYVELAGRDDGELFLHFFADAQPAYGWFFPAGEGLANVGVFLRTRVYEARGRPLRAILDDYLQRPELRARTGGRSPHSLASWQLPLFEPGRRRVFDGALLSGDAGGFVNAFTGAGIYEAMATGQAAATAALGAIARGDLSPAGLALYDEVWRAEIGRALHLGLLAQAGLTRAPWSMEWMFPAASAATPITSVLSRWIFSTRGAGPGPAMTPGATPRVA
ncbi:MAG: geranylgeranyl reductase family protein [Nannocystaceae bacterium]